MFFNKSLGGILLVAGTCIGAGMLALPIATAAVGFWCAGILMVVTGALMMITGLYTAEVNLWFKGDASYITMAEKTLGKVGKHITAVLFLFLLYALVAAYIAGGASLISHFFSTLLRRHYPDAYSLLPWGLACGVLIYLGARAVDVINKILVGALVLAYVILLVLLLPQANYVPHTLTFHPTFIWTALPILLTSYGYHIAIPSVSRYLGHNATQLSRAIVVGSSIALMVYLIWVYLVFGVVANSSLLNSQLQLSSCQSTLALTVLLTQIVTHSWVPTIIGLFIFFALSTSFIGVALGLFHMIADGLKMRENKKNKVTIAIITFVPPLLFAAFYPQGFILALSYAGIIVAIIHGILPAVMVWRGRYSLSFAAGVSYRVAGGKWLLVLVMALSTIVIAAAMAGYLGWSPLYV